jgi:hypothetical protein
VISLLMRWLVGTHRGALSAEHFAYYLDELTVRFNRRGSKGRCKLFYRVLVEQACHHCPATYRRMVDRLIKLPAANHNWLGLHESSGYQLHSNIQIVK